MENLDYYDRHGEYLGTKSREEVHMEGLWHKTVHCWLYDREGNAYFQIRKDSGKLYTTASGHISAGETVEEAFGREVSEEIGVDVDQTQAELIEITAWKMDKQKPAGMWRDRVFANVYMAEFTGEMTDFHPQEEEVLGVVKVNAQAALDMIRNEAGEAQCEKALLKSGQIEVMQDKLNFDDFLVMPGEIALIKYGKILQTLIAKCNELNS